MGLGSACDLSRAGLEAMGRGGGGAVAVGSGIKSGFTSSGSGCGEGGCGAAMEGGRMDSSKRLSSTAGLEGTSAGMGVMEMLI